jgi:hypothetical protein
MEHVGSYEPAEVVHRADQIHAVMQSGPLPRQRTSAANQCRNPRTKRRVQAFNVGGSDHSNALSRLQQSLDLGFCSLHNTSYHANHSPVDILLDYLSNGDAIPRPQTRPPGLPRDGFPEGLAIKPCIFTRISSAWTCPKSRGCSKCSCTCWQCLPDRLCQLRTVRSSRPNAATMVCTGQPYASKVTTVTTLSLSVRNR